MTKVIYLDNNATTKLLPQAKISMLNVMDTPHNASAIHVFGRRAKNIIEEARHAILESLGLYRYDGYTLTFTSSGTESNNLILANFKHDNVITSTTEHQSIAAIARTNRNFHYVQVDANGIVDLTDLNDKLKGLTGRKLISIIFANNETGVIQPIKEIIDIGRKFGAYIHSDFTQAIGKITFDLKDLALDFITISGHKFGGPLGSAALISKENIALQPIIIGGGQEKNLRSGTENIVGIVGFAAACKFSKAMCKAMLDHTVKQRDRLEHRIAAICKHAVIAGQSSPRLPNTSLIIMPDVESQLQLISFDIAGVAVSSGSACSSGKVASSHVLQAMGIAHTQAKCAIRVSLSYDQAPTDVDHFVNIWRDIYNNSNKLMNVI